MTYDTVVMRKNLRRDTAKLLKLDIDNLTPAQSVRLDRASTLRLELNDIEERKLIGAPFDTAKYIAASEALERMLGGDPERAHEQDFSADAAALKALLYRRADALAQRRDSEAKSIEASTSENHATGQYLPIAKQRAPTETVDSPVAELMPANEVPPTRPRVEYIDETPSREKPPSPTTQSYFSSVPAAGGLGPLRRGADWLPKGNF
jgi:hypothetical protein